MHHINDDPKEKTNKYTQTGEKENVTTVDWVKCLEKMDDLIESLETRAVYDKLIEDLSDWNPGSITLDLFMVLFEIILEQFKIDDQSVIAKRNRIFNVIIDRINSSGRFSIVYNVR